MARINIPQDVFEEAVRNSGGILTSVQKKLAEKGYKLSRFRLIEKIKERPTILQLLEEEREKVKDRAEANIISAVAEGDIKASLEYLKRQAQDRGWGDESSINVKGLENLKIQVKFIDKKDVKRDKGT